MALQYASIEDVKRYLRANQRKIIVGKAGETQADISPEELESFVQDSEDKLDALLAGTSIDAKASKYIVVRWACVDIYRALYPRSSVNEIPRAVLGWKEDANEMLEKTIAQATGAVGAIADWGDQI